MSQSLGLGLDNKGSVGYLGTAWGPVILITAASLVLFKKKQNQRGSSDKARTSRLANPVGVLI